MASRGIWLSLALAFALLLLNISCCTCLTITRSSNSGTLTEEEAEEVYAALETVVNNTENDILPSRRYHAGRIFYKYLNVSGKGVVIRLTRWSSQCSVSMSDADKTIGSELLEAFQSLLPTIQPYLVGQGYEWVAVSNLTDWIDYYVRETYDSSAAPVQPADAGATNVISNAEVNGEADCTIQPHMLLSHHSAHAFNQLHPGDSLFSPNASYKFTIPPSAPEAACVLNLEDKDDKILWQSADAVPQINCNAAFRSDGTLELWNNNTLIWHNVSACSPLPKCAGAASLAVDDDGNVILYRSVGNYLGIYWTAMNPN